MRLFGWHIILLGHFCITPFLAAQPQTPLDTAVLPSTVEDPAAIHELGKPAFISHFAPSDYGAQGQNWAVTQDHQGLIYAANFDGILQYDGETWQLIRTPTNAMIRSLATDGDGRVYVGAQSDLGYLGPDSLGALTFFSLLEAVPQDTMALGDVWAVHALADGIYFQTWKRLMRWDGTAMRVWSTESYFHTSFVVEDRLFVNEIGKGLHELRNDSLFAIRDANVFADKYVYAMLPLGSQETLVVTRNNGAYRLTSAGVEPFRTGADAYLQQNRIYQGRVLWDGTLALATQEGGIVLLTPDGTRQRILNTDNVLPDNTINYLYEDAQGGLWAALDNRGLVRLDVPSPLTTFTADMGLDGIITQIMRYQDELYVGTRAGLFVLYFDEDSASYRFRRAAEIQSPVWSLAVFDEMLLIGTSEGIFALQQGAVRKISERWAFSLWPSQFHQGVVYVGSNEEVFQLRYQAAAWEEIQPTKLVGQQVWSFFEADPNTLWLGALVPGVMRLTFPSGWGGDYSVEVFGAEAGLDNTRINVYTWKGEPVFASQQGLFRYNGTTDQDQFVPADDLLALLGGVQGDSLKQLVQTADGSLWASYMDKIVIAQRQADGTYQLETPPVLHFPKQGSRLYVEPNGIAWISNDYTLYRYDPGIEKDYTTAYSALVRRAQPLGLGQPLYRGTTASLADADQRAAAPSLRYDFNDLRFTVAATSFNNPEGTQYQYFLDGEDPTWSPWIDTAERLYPNLLEGEYTLRVRAKNAQGVVSEEGMFAFEVLAPWYRTGWAYAAYALGLLFIGMTSWRYQQMVQQNKEAQLHAVALQREREANEQLVQANTRLQEANRRLEEVNLLKDELIASVSHELRTPLTAILGFASVLKEEIESGEHREFLQIIHDNGNRLLSTLDGLLDLAKLRAGVMDVHKEVLHVSDETRAVVRLLENLAQGKQINLHLEPPAHPLYAMLDRHLYERILFNLIGNAIKFTDEGEVRVKIVREDNQVAIQVHDTGIGISEEFLPYLFDPFKQESSGFSRTHEGSGLGLTLTAELVELLQGTINVKSRKGKGSIFVVRFPLYQPAVAAPALA